MTMTKPLVTVLMTVYDGEPYLQEAVESILAQTYPHFRFLILDNASTDHSREIIRGFGDSRIELVELPENVGQIGALNKGLEMINTPYVARIDADDISLPTRLQEQVAILEQVRQMVIVGSAYQRIDESGALLRERPKVVYPVHDTDIRWQMLFHTAFTHSAVTFRSDPLLKNGLRYDPRFALSEDYRLWSQLLRHGQAMNVEHPLIKFRIHSRSQASMSGTQQGSSHISVARSNLERLGVHISESEMRTLRDWRHGPTGQLTMEDSAPCRSLLQILGAFEQQPGLDPARLRRIRLRLVDRTLSAIPINQLAHPWALPLVWRMLFRHPAAVAVHMAKRPVRKFKGMLESARLLVKPQGEDKQVVTRRG